MTKKTTNNKRNKSTIKAADKLLSFVAQTILLVALVQPVLTTDNRIMVRVIGIAMAYVGLDVAAFAYKHIICPSAKAIINSVQ